MMSLTECLLTFLNNKGASQITIDLDESESASGDARSDVEEKSADSISGSYR